MKIKLKKLKRKNKNKKAAEEELIKVIFFTVILIFVLIAVLYFVSQSAKGDLAKKQVVAKEVALIANLMRPGTEIAVNSNDKEGLTIEAKDNNILVNIDKANAGNPYIYEFYNPNVIIEVKDGKTIISLLEAGAGAEK